MAIGKVELSVCNIMKHKNKKRCVKIAKNKKWEKIIDFTKIKKGGVDINDVLACLLKQ